jgi:c-di-GMP-binding flagellar brake protein YcgR
MTEIKRSHPRHDIRINAALTCLSTDSRIVKTRDISTGGIFLLLDNPNDFPIGEMAKIHYLDPLNNEADTFKDGVIVRVTHDGIAISFVELGDF